MNQLLDRALERGFEFYVRFDKTTKKVVYEFYGFYKHGTARLTEIEDRDYMMAETRYGQTEVLQNFDDLVVLNFKIWQEYKKDYPYPDENWGKEFIRLGLANKKVKVNPQEEWS